MSPSDRERIRKAGSLAKSTMLILKEMNKGEMSQKRRTLLVDLLAENSALGCVIAMAAGSKMKYQ